MLRSQYRAGELAVKACEKPARNKAFIAPADPGLRTAIEIAVMEAELEYLKGGTMQTESHRPVEGHEEKYTAPMPGTAGRSHSRRKRNARQRLHSLIAPAMEAVGARYEAEYATFTDDTPNSVLADWSKRKDVEEWKIIEAGRAYAQAHPDAYEATEAEIMAYARQDA